MFIKFIFYLIIFIVVYRLIKNIFIGSGRRRGPEIDKQQDTSDKKIHIDRKNIEDATFEDLDSEDKNN